MHFLPFPPVHPLVVLKLSAATSTGSLDGKGSCRPPPIASRGPIWARPEEPPQSEKFRFGRFDDYRQKPRTDLEQTESLHLVLLVQSESVVDSTYMCQARERHVCQSPRPPGGCDLA